MEALVPLTIPGARVKDFNWDPGPDWGTSQRELRLCSEAVNALPSSRKPGVRTTSKEAGRQNLSEVKCRIRGSRTRLSRGHQASLADAGSFMLPIAVHRRTPAIAQLTLVSNQARTLGPLGKLR